MDSKIYDIFCMTDKREEALWKDAIIVFDTSSIGDLYFLKEDAKETMVAIFQHLSDRCWLPAQVMFEYQKNRAKFITNPIEEKYQNPDFTSNRILMEIDNYLSKNVQAPYYHPYLDKDAADEITTRKKDIEAAFLKIKETVKDQHDKRKVELQHVKDDDILFNQLSQMSIGKPYAFNEVMSIIEEGELRYRNLIPPGYMDAPKKAGTQKYGDLIIWKEILQQAQSVSKPVIYVCDDFKEIYVDDKKSGCYTPRHEMIREFIDETGYDIWIYPMLDFIKAMEKRIIDPDMKEIFKGLDQVKHALDLRALERGLTQDEMIICCGKCGKLFKIGADDLNLDFEDDGWTERDMGTEVEYTSNEYIMCPDCDNEIDIDLHVYEYPAGSVNDTEIEAKDGYVIRPMRLDDKIEIQEHDSCVRCGEWKVLNSDGYCEECMREFKEMIARED